jgi:molecular chaperone DnaK
MVFQTENALKEVGDKISEEDRTKVQAEVDSLKAVVERTNIDSMTDAEIDELKSGKERLMEAAQTVFAKMYEAQNPNAGAGPQGAGPQAGPQGGYQNDDVVDGDYTEV